MPVICCRKTLEEICGPFSQSVTTRQKKIPVSLVRHLRSLSRRLPATDHCLWQVSVVLAQLSRSMMYHVWVFSDQAMLSQSKFSFHCKFACVRLSVMMAMSSSHCTNSCCRARSHVFVATSVNLVDKVSPTFCTSKVSDSSRPWECVCPLVDGFAQSLSANAMGPAAGISKNR